MGAFRDSLKLLTIPLTKLDASVPNVNLKIEAPPMLENVLLRELIAAAIIFLLGARTTFILARPGMRRTGP